MLASRLTLREIEVMVLVACGKTSWEIARILEVSEHTITRHMYNVCKKLNVHNKVSAVVVALRNGIISYDDIDFSKTQST